MSDYDPREFTRIGGVNPDYVPVAEAERLRAELAQTRVERDEERALRRQEYDTQERYRDALERIKLQQSLIEAKQIACVALATSANQTQAQEPQPPAG